jgi:putative ABC transport system permease protein
MGVQMKTASAPETLITAAWQQVRALDSELPIYNVRTLAALRADNIAPDRLNLAVLGIFAALALALAMVGLGGVLAYAVAQRQREIGVRMALGAQRGDVLRLVIGEGMKLVLIGALLGLGGALALTRLLKTLLFGVSATDPLTFILIAALLIIVALLACWIPAQRATKVDPMVALRVE